MFWHHRDLFLMDLYVTGSSYSVWRRRCQIPQRHWYPRLHLQHLHGWQVPMYLCANFSHHALQAGCIFKYLTSFSNHICFFSRSRCFNNSDGDFLIGEEKGLQMFFAVIFHKKDDSSIPLVPILFFRFPCVCLSLSVCVCSPPAGWDLDHHRVWENDGRAQRDLCHPGEACAFITSLFSQTANIVSALTPDLPYLGWHCVVLFKNGTYKI